MLIIIYKEKYGYFTNQKRIPLIVMRRNMEMGYVFNLR